MITLEQYFGPRLTHPEVTDEIRANAEDLLKKVNSLLEWAAKWGGWDYPTDPDTGTCVSGSKGGSGDGGWRPSNATTGAPKSPHKKGQGVDVYDPENRLDKLLSDEILASFDLYREHPGYTIGWCHLQSTPPRSGKRTYIP